LAEVRLGNSAVNEGERSASCPTCFILRKKNQAPTGWYREAPKPVWVLLRREK